MLLPLAYFPDPVLFQTAERVNFIDDQLRQLVNDMVQTMHAHRGIGLAAPQVFHSLALFVSCVPFQNEEGKWLRGKNRVFINPRLIHSSSDFQLSEEGCLSIPNAPVTVQRASSIHIQATDLTGETFEETLTGLYSANFLHEFDHLQGILILDYLSEDEKKKVEIQLKESKPI